MAQPTCPDNPPLADPRLTYNRLKTILARCEITSTGCWEWTGARDRRGYGRVGFGARKLGVGLVYKVVYEATIGLVPAGLELDHLCRNPACANPGHLEPVTHAENVRRGEGPALLGQRNRSITHCPQGHPYDEANTYRLKNGGRGCKTCRREWTRRWHARGGP